MKRLLFIFSLFIAFFTSFPTATYADIPRCDPNASQEIHVASATGSGCAESSRVVFKIADSVCPGESKVTFYWDNLPPGDQDNWWSNACADFSGGIAKYNQDPGGFYAGTYKVGYSCGCPIARVKPVHEVGTVVIAPMSATPTFSYTPENLRRGDPSTTLIAHNCLPDSTVTFTYTNLSSGQSYGQYIESDSPKVTADGSGNASYQRASGFNPGNYSVKIRCGGVEVEAGQFTVSNERVTPTPVPEPPPPGCKTFVQNRCVAVDTAIGVINTTDEGFIINIFLVFLGLSGGISLLLIIYAGYLIITSRGTPEQLQKGRELLTSALVGLLFIIFSFVIFETLTVDILHLPGFTYTR